MEPVFGLMVTYRPYVCTACGHKDSVQTNHTGECYHWCHGCSWTVSKYPGMTFNGRMYRKFSYVGEAPTDINPNAPKKEEASNGR